jgi:hypothetical protein
VSSRHGKGSLFMFHLPVSAGPAAAAERSPCPGCPEPALAIEAEEPLDARMLPAALIADLRAAVLGADIQRVTRCAEEARAFSPALSRRILAHAGRYDYPALLTLLGE